MMPRTSTVVLLGFFPFLYVAGASLAGLSAEEVAIALGTYLLALALNLYYLVEPRRGVWVGGVGTLGLALELFVTALDPARVGTAGGAVAWGTLLASPVIILVNFVRTSEGIGTRLVGLQLALADGLLLLSVPTVLANSGTPVTAGNLVSGTFAGIGEQITGIIHLLFGLPVGNLPLAGVNDPWFAGLAGLAVLATFLTFVRPSTGREVDLPTQGSGAPGPDPDGTTVETLSPGFREVLRARSTEDGAPAGTFPGAAALLSAGIAGGLMLAVVFAAPAAALLLMALATVGVLAAVLFALRRPLE